MVALSLSSNAWKWQWHHTYFSSLFFSCRVKEMEQNKAAKA